MPALTLNEAGVTYYVVKKVPTRRPRTRRKPKRHCDPDSAKCSKRQVLRVICQRYIGKVDSHSLA